jgi:hypothetical protein
MTDTIIQFKYSDNVHLVALYIKSDTHQELFIPLLFDIALSCEYTSRNRGWDYVVAEMVSKLVQKYDSKVKFILESQCESLNVIYRYSVTVKESLYNRKQNPLADPNKLIDFLEIKYFATKYTFTGLLKDFYNNIIQLNNQYLIEKTEKEISLLQSNLKGLKK